jgi:hypothetical protein
MVEPRWDDNPSSKPAQIRAFSLSLHLDVWHLLCNRCKGFEVFQ